MDAELREAADTLLTALEHGSSDEIQCARGDLEIAVNRTQPSPPDTSGIEGIRRTCFLPVADPDFTWPTPGEVKLLVRKLGWSGSRIARELGLSPANGNRTVRLWQSAERHHPIPYAAWRLLCQIAEVDITT